MTISFEQIVRSRPVAPPNRILCIDPGHTTGWAFFVRGHLDSWGQIQTSFSHLYSLYMQFRPLDVVVIEEYRIYANKAQQHIHSDVPTLRFIGAIEMLITLDSRTAKHAPRTRFQSASCKSFAYDNRLKEWAMYQPGQPHATDAIRHGVYYLCAAPQT